MSSARVQAKMSSSKKTTAALQQLEQILKKRKSEKVQLEEKSKGFEALITQDRFHAVLSV